MSLSRRARVLAAALLATIGSGCAISPAGPDARTYRIGFQHTPPRQFVDTQGRPAGDVTGRVGITEGLARTIAREHLRQPRLEVFATIPALVESICGNGVAVGVIAESAAHASLFRKPKDCVLQMSPIPGARMWSGIASAPNDAGAARVADRLHEEIGAMVEDGTFSTISPK